MASIEYYNDLIEKKKRFLNHFTIINTKEEFDLMYGMFPQKTKNKKTSMLFRGMKEAKYKLYTSAQRLWINNQYETKLSGHHLYLRFISSIIEKAKQDHLLNKVFSLYKYNNTHESDFPLLSILQHYGAPTPLMDWTYNIDVALFFATEDMNTNNITDNSINNYFSIYFIWKPDYVTELKNLIEVIPGYYPPILNFADRDDDSQVGTDKKKMIFYISDFDEGNSTLDLAKDTIEVRNDRPLTLLFNQNIVAQEGLFIFNPYSKIPLEDIFNEPLPDRKPRLFRCFNIKKELAEYVKAKIMENSGIDRSYIYPDLRDDSKKIVDSVLSSLPK